MHIRHPIGPQQENICLEHKENQQAGLCVFTPLLCWYWIWHLTPKVSCHFKKLIKINNEKTMVLS
jgi:hypothetical protein